MSELTRYTFSVKTGEESLETGRPVYQSLGVKLFSHDAQAEMHARNLSESRQNAFVRIRRGDASWVVRSGNLDTEPTDTSFDALNYTS